jgi:hypothetical protein
VSDTLFPPFTADIEFGLAQYHRLLTPDLLKLMRL